MRFARCLFPVINCNKFSIFQSCYHKPTTTKITSIGINDGKGQLCCNSSINRISTHFQNCNAYFACKRMCGNNGTIFSNYFFLNIIFILINKCC